MNRRNPISIIGETFIAKESIVEESGASVWTVSNSNKEECFVVHTFSKGKMYITFFKNIHIQNDCSVPGIKSICKVLLERGEQPSIQIKRTNVHLIVLCKKVGFRKHKQIRDLYYLESVKEEQPTIDL